MPVHVVPRSDADRYTFMKAAMESHASDERKEEPILRSSTVVKLLECTEPLKLAMEKVMSSSAVRAREVSEKNSALTNLNTYVRDFWVGARNRINRENLPAGNLKYYQLPLSGLLPAQNISSSLITTAELIIAGDAQAVADGFEAMSNPSAAQLQDVLEAAKKEAADVPVADAAVDSAEAELAALRNKADEVINKVVKELRFFLDDEDESSQRRIMRRYGVKFRSEQQGVSAAE